MERKINLYCAVKYHYMESNIDIIHMSHWSFWPHNPNLIRRPFNNYRRWETIKEFNIYTKNWSLLSGFWIRAYFEVFKKFNSLDYYYIKQRYKNLKPTSYLKSDPIWQCACLESRNSTFCGSGPLVGCFFSFWST